jgi:hypothetical protein
VVLAEPSNIPIGVIDGVIFNLAEQPMAEVYQSFVADRPEIARILARSAETPSLTAQDQAVVVQTFADNGIELTGEPGSDVPSAMTTLQAAWAFGQ